MHFLKRFSLFCLFLTIAFVSNGQDSKLARQYYQDGEYEKAAALYKKLYSQQKSTTTYFNNYINCLIELEDFATAEKTIQKEMKKKPNEVEYFVYYGELLERQFKEEDAKEMYAKAINKLPAEKFKITRLANTFISKTKYQLAVQTYEQGSKLLDSDNIFAYSMADIYRRQGKKELMIKYYLNSLGENPNNLSRLRTIFQRYLEKEDYFELQTQLYERIQDDEESLHYPELLTWVFVQNKDYSNALRQVKALDRRMGENGNRVMKLGRIAQQDKDYDAAIAAYEYIIIDKGNRSTYYLTAKELSLSAKRDKLVQGFDYTDAELRVLEQEYEIFINEFGRNKTTAAIVAEYANLEAFYLNDLEKAIGLLDEMIQYPGVRKNIKAKAKISLGDFYLMKGEVWESTLLYSQVDKAYKDGLLGEEARYRNAKLAYYNGNFQWAQSQFDVLKASTSKLISNDAIDLSVFIMDNMGLDTTAAPLELFAESDLLVFQNRFDDAFGKLEQIISDFPYHSLEDDIYYKKANIYVKQRNYLDAVKMYEKVITDHKEEIRADNALYELAGLYETVLNDKVKAQELYEQLFMEFSDSTFSVEARKKFRSLRGDEI